jgi:hypothetical protein
MNNILHVTNWLTINPNKLMIYKSWWFFLHESKISLQLMETNWIVIYIVEKDKWWRCLIKWFICFFKLIWWSSSLMQIWHNRKKQSIFVYCIVSWTWMTFLYFIYYHSILVSLTLILLFKKIKWLKMILFK